MSPGRHSGGALPPELLWCPYLAGNSDGVFIPAVNWLITASTNQLGADVGV